MNNSERIKEMVKNIFDNHNISANNDDTSNLRSDYSNVISIVGDRGYGKTTTLKACLDELTNTNEYIVCDTIDPLSILKVDNKANYGLREMILALFYNELQKTDYDYNHKNKIIDDLNSLTETYIDGFKNYDDIYSGGISILDKIVKLDKSQEKFQKITKTLVDDMARKKGIIITIDDFDLLDSKIINNVINDLQELMHIKGIVFIIAYREEQLSENISIFNMTQKQAALKSNLTSVDKISSQSYKIVQKIFERGNKIILPTIKEIYEMDYDAFIENSPFSNDPVFTEFSDNAINEAGRKRNVRDTLENRIEEIINFEIRPHLVDESTYYFLPTNIRGIVQLIEELATLHKMINEAENKFEAQIYANNRFYDYVYNQFIETTTQSEFREIIQTFRTCENNLKNWTIVSGIRNYCRKNTTKENLEDYADISCFRDFSRDAANLSLGDLLETINDFKSHYDNENGWRFVYAIKVLYSLEITKILLQYKNEENEKNRNELFKSYRNYVGGYPVPFSKVAFDVKWNKVFEVSDLFNEHIYQYEKELLLYNIVTPVTYGDKVLHNNSYINDAAGSTISKAKKELRKQNKMNIFNFDPLSKKDSFDFIKDENKEDIYNWLMRYNYNTKTTIVNAPLLFDPFVFLIREDYVKYAIEKDILVINDLFTLDYITDVSYWRASEDAPIRRFYKMFVDRISNKNTNDYSISSEDEYDDTNSLNTDELGMPVLQNRVITDLDNNPLSDTTAQLIIEFLNIPDEIDKHKLSIVKKNKYLLYSKLKTSQLKEILNDLGVEFNKNLKKKATLAILETLNDDEENDTFKFENDIHYREIVEGKQTKKNGDSGKKSKKDEL